MIRPIFLSIILLFLAGCEKSLEMASFAAWVKNPENGLLKQREMGNYIFSAQFKPAAMVAVLETGGKVNPESESFLNRTKELEELYHFTYKIKGKDGYDALSSNTESDGEYFERLEHFLDGAQMDFLLVTGSDTLPCQLYHLERTYGLVPETTMLLTFPKIKTELPEFKLLYNDKILGSGPVVFEYKIKDLKSTPKIKMKNA
jgi:hypothetical protein